MHLTTLISQGELTVHLKVFRFGDADYSWQHLLPRDEEQKFCISNATSTNSPKDWPNFNVHEQNNECLFSIVLSEADNIYLSNHVMIHVKAKPRWMLFSPKCLGTMVKGGHKRRDNSVTNHNVRKHHEDISLSYLITTWSVLYEEFH